MEESESIMYVLLLAAALFIMPDASNKSLALSQISLLLILGATILIAISIILISIKNIPILSPYIPVTLGDNTIKVLAWIGVLVVGILVIIITSVNLIVD
jgi:hypothetical protein